MDDFLKIYQSLNASNIESVRDIYSKDITFIDPVHEIHGIEELIAYFTILYKNVDSIEFVFANTLLSNDKGYVSWEMTYNHKKVNKGMAVTVHGASYLEFNENKKVYGHRDYFDLGEMLYEHIPLLGQVILAVKRRLVK